MVFGSIREVVKLKFATCTYHFDNGIVLSVKNFTSTDGLSAFQLLVGEFPMVSH